MYVTVESCYQLFILMSEISKNNAKALSFLHLSLMYIYI